MTLPAGLLTDISYNTDINKTPFVFFQSDPDDYHKYQKTLDIEGNTNFKTDNSVAMSSGSVRGLQSESLLTTVFFHPKNIDHVQKKIIKHVYIATNGEYLIEQQNELDVLVVMRGVFIQNAKHLNNNIKHQITELDDIVVKEIVPGIVSELCAYKGYIRDVFGPTQIMDRPENVSNAGIKTLPSVMRW